MLTTGTVPRHSWVGKESLKGFSKAWSCARMEQVPPSQAKCMHWSHFVLDMGIKKATPSSLISAFSTEKKRPTTFVRRIHKASWLYTSFSRPLERGCVDWTMTKYAGLDVCIYIYNIYKETVTVCKNDKSNCYAKGSIYNINYIWRSKIELWAHLSELPAFRSPF